MADEPEVLFGKWLIALRRAVENPIRTLTRIGVLVTSRIQNRFSTQVGPDGKAWPERMTPNIPGILEDLERGSKIKERRWVPRPVLLDSGLLKWSIAWRLDSTDSVTIGTAVDHAKYHQFGLERMIKITQTMKDGIREMLRDFRRRVKRINKRRAKGGMSPGNYPRDVGKLAFLLHRDEFRFTAMERPFVGVDDQDREDIYEIIRSNFLKDNAPGL